MESSSSKAEFAALVRRSGVSLSEEELVLLHEGYGLLERLVADLDRPADASSEPALVFAPQSAP